MASILISTWTQTKLSQRKRVLLPRRDGKLQRQRKHRFAT